MTKLKYYIPIYGTNLRVDKFPEVAVMMPSAEQIGEHLLAQRVRMSQGEKYQALQIFITEDRYDTILKGIRRKIGIEYASRYIDIIYDNVSNPIVQIAVRAEVESKEEE